jgi:aryl-alcohol dehydrogenase-like predicted oxidoreductase
MSQERLQTGFLDLYILHRDDPSRPVGPIVEVLNELHEAGMIGLFGGSNWTIARVLEANRYAAEHGLKPFSAVSPNYSLGVLERDPWGGSVTLSGAQGTEYREWLAQNQMLVFTYSSISRGFFSGKYDPDSGLAIEDCLPPSPIKEYDSPANRERLRRA